LYPLYGLKVSLAANITLTMWFTVLSLVRGYLVRRLFNWFQIRPLAIVVEAYTRYETFSVPTSRKAAWRATPKILYGHPVRLLGVRRRRGPRRQGARVGAFCG